MRSRFADATERTCGPHPGSRRAQRRPTRIKRTFPRRSACGSPSLLALQTRLPHSCHFVREAVTTPAPSGLKAVLAIAENAQSWATCFYISCRYISCRGYHARRSRWSRSCPHAETVVCRGRIARRARRRAPQWAAPFCSARSRGGGRSRALRQGTAEACNNCVRKCAWR
jgi:hypothetical protein